MSVQRLALSIVSICLVLILGLAAFGDRLTLKDGKVLEGTVIKQGDRYWVKTSDGSTQYVSIDDVSKLEKGSGKSITGSSDIGGGSSSAAGFSSSLASTQRRANSVDKPLAAVTIWQDFIDSKPSEADLKVAKEELARWKSMAENGGEKINGRWVTGDEYKSLMTRYRAIMREATNLLSHDDLLKGAEKVEEARRIYPNDFAVNFWLGYVELKKRNWEKAIPYFDAVLKLKPNLPEAMANVAIAEWFKSNYRDSKAVLKMHDAAKQGDNEEIVFDLISMLNSSPPAFLRSTAGKAAVEDARLLSYKYKINQNAQGTIYYVRLHEESVAEHSEHNMWSGTGFILKDDGLILTNRHVAKDAKKLMVLLHNGQQKAAEVVKIDDEQDLALIRLKNADSKLPVVRLAASDLPMDGADCTVIGYPLVDRLGGSPKITHGIVSSSIKKGAMSVKSIGLEGLTDEIDVLIDAKVNPGNSGGPILDKYGNVMAIVCMKSLASETEDSYGMGISAGRIRKFLAKNRIMLPRGENGTSTLSVEDIAAKVEPAAVLIFATK